MSVLQRLVDASAQRLTRKDLSRRSFLVSTAVVGSALVVAPRKFILEPISAYATICGPASDCASGYTVFCCTINNGVNTCPPGTFAGGWWKADTSSWCCGSTARYYVDCQGECTGCGCSGSPFCNPSCVDCVAGCNGGPSCDQRRVCWNVFRYGQCNQEIGCSGPVACRMVTCVPPWQIGWLACTADVATDDNTGEHSAPCLVPGCDSAVELHYWNLGGPSSVLGSVTQTLTGTPDGIGQYEHYQFGSIYWTASTGAWEVHGAIQAHWAALRWEASVVGYPITDETATPDGIGRYNHFQYGSIYWTPYTGAWEVHGAIRAHWAALGWERSVVGYPVTDEIGTPDGIGRFNHFQYGSIYFTPQTGAWEVHGAIRAHWAALGWERSVVGYPTSDETPVGDGIGRYNKFQHGTIYWSPTTGAFEVHGAILQAYLSVQATRSRLGYPTSDVFPTLAGSRSTFQGGYIDWYAFANQTSITYT